MDNWATGQKCLVHLQQGSKHAKKPLGPIKKNGNIHVPGKLQSKAAPQKDLGIPLWYLNRNKTKQNK